MFTRESQCAIVSIWQLFKVLIIAILYLAWPKRQEAYLWKWQKVSRKATQNALSPLSVDCLWGQWTGWGSCTVTCGGGTQTSTRVINQEAQNEGIDCVGNSARDQSCNTNDCPGKTLPDLFLQTFLRVNCTWFGECPKLPTEDVFPPRKPAHKVVPSSFSGLPMGTMDRMGILQCNMWGNSDFNEGDRARSAKWRKRLCGRLDQRSALQYKWLPR